MIIYAAQNGDDQSIAVLNAMATAKEFDATPLSYINVEPAFDHCVAEIFEYLGSGPVDDIPSARDARDKFWELYNARN